MFGPQKKKYKLNIIVINENNLEITIGKIVNNISVLNKAKEKQKHNEILQEIINCWNNGGIKDNAETRLDP